MSLPLSMTCKDCGHIIGTIISPTADYVIPLELEFACRGCIEKIAQSKAITLNSETGWGKVIAELKGRR
jgi:hypothetical protein